MPAAGSRGKGGGVKLAKSPEEAREKASQILGMQLVTRQAGPEGQLVRKALAAGLPALLLLDRSLCGVRDPFRRPDSRVESRRARNPSFR